MSAATRPPSYEGELITVYKSSSTGPSGPALRPSSRQRGALLEAPEGAGPSKAPPPVVSNSGCSIEQSESFEGEIPIFLSRSIEGKCSTSSLESSPPSIEVKRGKNPHRFARWRKGTALSPLKQEVRLSGLLSTPAPPSASRNGRQRAAMTQPDLQQTNVAEPLPVAKSAMHIFEALGKSCNVRCRGSPTSLSEADTWGSSDATEATYGDESGGGGEPRAEEVPGHEKSCAPCFYAGAPRVDCQACRYLRGLKEIGRQQRAANKASSPSAKVKRFLRKSVSCNGDEGEAAKPGKLKKLFKPVVSAWQDLKKG